MSGWRELALGDVVELKRGYDLPASQRRLGNVPIVSSSGRTGFHDEAKVAGPGVVTGRYGTLGEVFYIDEDFWPLNTALYVRDFKGNHPRFVAALLASLDLGRREGAAAVPGINRNHLHVLPVTVPDLSTQACIAGILAVFDDLIENNRRRIELLEQIARKVYQEWFVHFRYPGHEDNEFVESRLGAIPAGWTVRPLAELAAKERNAITAGPFGSKLGRKDYVEEGVPVIRGANLRVGGGFDASEFVFVSDRKADELRSCLARAGDVVVTQRGTLGQVGLIPRGLTWPRFVLSQSQMRVRVDPAAMTPEFLYAQLRSKEVTQRFIAQAMTSGVPHVNLALLREFEVLVPPIRLLVDFSSVVGSLDEAKHTLSRQAETLIRLRDLLLPELVTGAVEVSKLDLDELLEEPAA